MFLANNTLVITEKGSVLANSDYTSILSSNFIEVNKEPAFESCTFIKTGLLPTIAIGEDTDILLGKLKKQDDNIFIENNFYRNNNVKEEDYLVIPKINYNSENAFNKTIVWLYAKYITGGYYCLENQTHKPMIIIHLKHLSKKEAISLTKYKDIRYDLNKKIIFIKNLDIISELLYNGNHLNPKLYNCSDNLCNYFLHSILIETNNELKFKHKHLAFDIFMFLYSKLNKVYKIIEIKNENKKEYYLIEANQDEYIILENQLYSKIIKISRGKKISGIVIKNPQNAPLYCAFAIIK